MKVEVEEEGRRVRWSEGTARRSGKGEEEGGKRHRAGEEKYNDTIIKYKRWNTYYGDYGSFPYI